jgi:hypothetical protein
MRKFVTPVVFLLLCVNSVFSIQGTQLPPTKKAPVQKSTVDCSKVDDATLTANVKIKLANTPSLKDASINVIVKDNTVTLTGSVKKPTNKGLATLQAKRVPCVKKVDNQVTVEGKTVTEKKPKT